MFHRNRITLVDQAKKELAECISAQMVNDADGEKVNGRRVMLAARRERLKQLVKELENDEALRVHKYLDTATTGELQHG